MVDKTRDKFGNVDEFVTEVVNKLGLTLQGLTGQIKAAEKTINKTDRLNEERKKLINESVRKIKQLMDKEMVVKIETEDNNPDAVEDNGGGGEYRNNGGSNNGGSSFEVTENSGDKSNNSGGKATSTSKTPSVTVNIDSSTIGKAIAKAITDYLNQHQNNN